MTIPQPVIDAVEQLLKNQNKNVCDNYALRLNDIKEYCDAALKEYYKKK
jgi:hypothetical protein